MTPSTSVLSHPVSAPSRRGFMVLDGIGMCGVLVACGGRDSAEDEGTGPLRGTVTMWPSPTQGSCADRMKKMAGGFHKKDPDVTVKTEQFSWSEFKTKRTTGLTAGQVPDISAVLPSDAVEMINSEALVPLDKVIDSIGRDRFPKQVLAEGQSDGKFYSVPIYSHAQVMRHRKDVLSSKGPSVPTTWEELAKAAKTTGKFDSLYGLSMSLGTGDMLGVHHLNFYVHSAGWRPLKDDGTANPTSEAALGDTKYWTGLYKSASLEGSLDYVVPDQATLFYQGKTTSDFNSGFHVSEAAKDSPDLADSIAVAPLPRMKASDPADYPAEVSNVPLMVWEASKVKREVRAFLEFLSTKDKYIEFLHSVPGGMLPVLSDIAKGPGYTNNETIKKYSDSIRVIQDQVGTGTAIGTEKGPLIQAGVLVSQGLIEKMYHSIIIDKTDVEAAAKDCEKKLSEAFKTVGASIK